VDLSTLTDPGEIAFWAQYTATFGPPPAPRRGDKTAAEEARLWRSLIESIPFGQLDAVVGAVIAKRADARYRPHIEDFRRAVRTVVGGDREDAPQVVGCEFCKFRGVFGVVSHVSALGNRRLGLGPDAAVTFVPCRCASGKAYGKAPEGATEAAARWKVSIEDEMRHCNAPEWMAYETYLDALVKGAREGIET